MSPDEVRTFLNDLAARQPNCVEGLDYSGRLWMSKGPQPLNAWINEGLSFWATKRRHEELYGEDDNAINVPVRAVKRSCLNVEKNLHHETDNGVLVVILDNI